ncbi:hypothetical protein OIDMADRAFT_49514 [Oidiodendron maius Zn]|uniref:Uncharacterized protein n=1 Tax=Oidiodendron maius (strain Zn) TaxID=913774 RepID=A0A0C3HSL9_OIDMZ|nr:hypothetical protein OIDMADRAFT_49514 [Oidiodendron maius Zn]
MSEDISTQDTCINTRRRLGGIVRWWWKREELSTAENGYKRWEVRQRAGPARINYCRRLHGGAEGIIHAILGLAGWNDLGGGGRMAETRGGLEIRRGSENDAETVGCEGDERQPSSSKSLEFWGLN